MKVGESVRRPDGPAKVRGDFEYSSDLHSPGMLWGATTRSPHPYAHIRSIDISAARAMPGVQVVLTHSDLPGRNAYGLEFQDQPVLAYEVVRYWGEAVALVAARLAVVPLDPRPELLPSSSLVVHATLFAQVTVVVFLSIAAVAALAVTALRRVDGLEVIRGEQ